FAYAGFGCFARKIDLNKHRKGVTCLLLTNTLKPSREFDRVDGVYDVKKLHGPSRFVRLQMTDQVPLGAVTAKFNDLRFSFLDLVLAEDCHTGRDRVTQD